MTKLAHRIERTLPFHAIEVLKKAQALAAQGKDIISLGIGEPDFTAPTRVLETMNRAAQAGLSGYTAPAGTPALREAIAHYYKDHFHADIDPSRVLVTSGASGALLLAVMTLINPGDEVLMPDPSYPANQNLITAAGGITKLVPTDAAHRFQLKAQDIEKYWTNATRGVMIASPSNPTGTTIAYDELKQIVAEVRKRDGFIIMDEIYLGLYYGDDPKSALTIDDDIIIINSFSKYFHMTGWRLGWMIAPKDIVPAIEGLSSNLAICAPALAQHAAVSCFEPEVIQVYENRRLSFKERRDYLVPAFNQLGLNVPVTPDGAFYIFADVSKWGMDSTEFCSRMLEEAGIASVPGIDFGQAHAKNMVRFSYATSLDQLKQAVSRIETFLASLKS